MKTELKRNRWNPFIFFFDYYSDILYVTLIIFSGLVLSIIYPERQSIYLTILGVHILSLYIPYLMYVVLLKIEIYFRKKFSKKIPIIELTLSKMPYREIMILTNILLIVISVISKVYMATIFVVIAAITIAWLASRLKEILFLDGDVITISFIDSKIDNIIMKISEKALNYNGIMKVIIRLILKIIPFAIILIAVFLVNWSIIAKVVFFVAYLILIPVIQYLGENGINLKEVFEIIFL